MDLEIIKISDPELEQSFLSTFLLIVLHDAFSLLTDVVRYQHIVLKMPIRKFRFSSTQLERLEGKFIVWSLS